MAQRYRSAVGQSMWHQLDFYHKSKKCFYFPGLRTAYRNENTGVIYFDLRLSKIKSLNQNYSYRKSLEDDDVHVETYRLNHCDRR
jgi:hypothetical protein